MVWPSQILSTFGITPLPLIVLCITPLMMQPSAQTRWEGTVSTTFKNVTAFQVWPCFVDFFDIYKWFPNLTKSYGVSGNNGEVGCIRYCTNMLANPVIFVYEKLTAIDYKEMSLTFEVLENNIGFNNYVATWKLIPSLECEEHSKRKCVIEWTFATDPVEGMTLDEMKSKVLFRLKFMGQRMANDVLAP